MSAHQRDTACAFEIRVASDGIRLVGTIWTPADGAEAGVLMHPGSGPSNRNNDVLFPPIRAHLLKAGVAVCSFDKRGVGDSSGRWQDAGISEQADDLIVALDSFRTKLAGVPIGLFGHSQGGWVVVEAGGRGIPVAFVITNSGPGVSPSRQERHALANRMRRDRVSDDNLAKALAAFDALTNLMRERPSLDEALTRLDAAGINHRHFEGLEYMFEDESMWQFDSAIYDYDPARALSRITVPVLALFGATDEITPIAESVAAFHAAVRPDLLTVDVLPGGNHRLQYGDASRFVDGYLEQLTSFIRRATNG
jgi:pimeloyl-ACP methyl ester carboxylesterase